MKSSYKSPQDAADKWQRRVAGAGQDYQKGIASAGDWAGPAVAASARRNAGLQQAISDGRIDAGIQRAGTAGWKAAATGKGVAAYQARASASAPKYQAGYNRLLGYLNSAKTATQGMDRTTRAGRIAAAAAYQNAVGDASDQAKRGG